MSAASMPTYLGGLAEVAGSRHRHVSVSLFRMQGDLHDARLRSARSSQCTRAKVICFPAPQKRMER